MRWKLPWPKAATVGSSSTSDDEQPDGWQRHVEALRQAGIPEPGSAVQGTPAGDRGERTGAL
ncbi:hypothetical protein CCAE64S_00917 [Castellaniella caeni]